MLHRVNVPGSSPFLVYSIICLHQVTIADQTFNISDNFNLANPVISTLINGEQYTFQQMARQVTGYIKLQYLGTVVSVF